MTATDFTTSLLVDNSPEEVFTAINQVTQWWTPDLTGHSQQVGDEFTVQFADIHLTTQRLVEVVPNKKVVWLVTASDLSFIKDRTEWKGTHIVFEIGKQGDKTLLKFTHQGLVPTIECFNDCSKGWAYFIDGSLYKYLTTGKGTPGLI